MLLSFSVTNFRSYREEQSLSMVASPRQTDHPDHLIAIPGQDDKLLPAAVIYGANGSGKSNLVKALRFVEQLVMVGTEPKQSIGQKPFLFSKEWPDKPSEFETRFVNNGKIFTFGFSITDSQVCEEWLYVIDGKKESPLYERATAADGSVTIEIGKTIREQQSAYARVDALSKVGVRTNQLFLAAITESIEPNHQGPLFRSVIDWFDETLRIVYPHSNYGDLTRSISEDHDFAKFICEFLKDASTGVDALDAQTSTLDENQLNSMPDELRRILVDRKLEDDEAVSAGVPGAEFFVANEKDKKIQLRALTATHKSKDGTEFKIPFFEESDGTTRLTNLLPALHQSQAQQRVFVIDEIDRSLHPLLSRKFIESFLKIAKRNGSQIIVTTHETNLMDLDLLRRDELWLTEKNNDGASSLYSLSDFKIRNDLKIQRGYLSGRFGAIPFLNNIDRLMEQTETVQPNEPAQSKI